MQSVDVPALHSEQLLSHAWQSLLPSPYSPATQAERHVVPSLYGVPLTGHVRQSVASAPLHVAHDEWQL